MRLGSGTVIDDILLLRLRAILQLEAVVRGPGIPVVRVQLDCAVEPAPRLGDLALR